MIERRGAFSLIELMIVLSLVVILAAFLIPRVICRQDQRVIQELDRLEALFYTLQQRAVAGRKNITLIFDSGRNEYRYQAMSGAFHVAQLSPGLCFGVIPGALGPPWKAAFKIESLITFSKVDEKPTVVFFHNGKISSGTVYICDTNRLVGGALTCAVSQVFYIRKYMYNDKLWKLVNLQ